MINENLQIALSTFAKKVVKNSKAKLSRKHRDTRNLEGSIGYDLKLHKNSFSLSFYMLEYGAFVDEGVQGKKSSSKAPNSPFKFGTGNSPVRTAGGMQGIILAWIKRKGIKGRDKGYTDKNGKVHKGTGRFISHKSLSFLITRSIYNTGLKPTLFFTKPFITAFTKLPDELIEQFGLDVDEFLEQVTEGPEAFN